MQTVKNSNISDVLKFPPLNLLEFSLTTTNCRVKRIGLVGLKLARIINHTAVLLKYFEWIKFLKLPDIALY